jgi:thiol-disulfide isomerase/thioredoxin
VAVQAIFWLVSGRVDRARLEARLSVTMEPRSEAAPDLWVERSDGSRVHVPARSGRFQIVHFWATWCPPCREELPMILELAKNNRHRLTVWAISTDPDWSIVRRYLDEDVPAQVVRDAGGAGSRAFRVTGLPDSYLIGPDGLIRARFSGAQRWTSKEMDRILDRLMQGS